MVFKSRKDLARESRSFGFAHADDSVTPIGQIPSTSNMVSTMFVVPVSSHLQLR